jgi:hypothetical protein
VPALQPYLIEPICQQFSALLPERRINHPLGCHRPRIPDRIIFEKLVEGLVFGCAPANRHDSPLLAPTLDAARALGLVAQGASVRLDRGCDSDLTRQRLLERKLLAEISKKGRPAPTGRWIVERTPTPGKTPTRSWCGVPSVGRRSSTSGWPSGR